MLPKKNKASKGSYGELEDDRQIQLEKVYRDIDEISIENEAMD